jgi:hypothetical protein
VFAFNVSDVDVAVLLGLTNSEFSHINVAELLGNGDTFGPVDAAAVVIPYGSRNGAIRETKVLKKVSDGKDGLRAFIGRVYFGFA